ncbi:McrC family protein [Kitasatospora sp. NPDC057738]|uniref:McrC family protein n=1 Tax=Kitasatospora sp. NPDC057738 TaxID=3346233 RepID=UPI00368208F4
MAAPVRIHRNPGTVVSLREGDAWSAHNLTSAQASVLAESELVDLRPNRNGAWEIRPKNVIGAVRRGYGADAVQLRILPKVRIDRLLFLLQYAARGIEWRPEPVDATERDDLLPAIAHALCSAAERALLQGPLNGYREVRDSSPVARGRLLITEQLRRRPGRPVPFEVEYDEYTADVPENRILLGAVHHLLRLPDLTPAQRTRLRALATRLDGVHPAQPGRPLPLWSANRLNSRYSQALALSDLVLRGASYEFDDGCDLLVDGLLLRMWMIYEEFVGKAVGAALDQDHRHAFSQTPDTSRHLDARRGHLLKPDLVHYRRSPDGPPRPVAVVDAKYKQDRSRDDLYQMLAYCLRLDLTEGHLVYVGGRPDTVEIPVPGGRILIHRHRLDLAAPHVKLQLHIAAIADSVRRGLPSWAAGD